MTQEEKAKAYDKAIERAKAFNNGKDVNIEAGTTLCEYIFPELKESEDERIREALIALLKFGLKDGSAIAPGFNETKKQALAWLEKQCERFDDNIITSSDGRIRKAILTGLIDCRDAPDLGWSNFGGIEIDDCIAWLEKQGESNPYSGVSFKYNGHTWGMCARDNGVEILVDGEIKERVFLGNKPQGKSVLEAIQEEKVDNTNKIEPTINPHFGKPIDKVEPKFKDGDWITNGEYTWKVISVDYLDYTLQNQWGECVEDTVDYVNKAFHLWTIQDAKDGDVIAFDNGTIVIFKDLYNSTSFHSYCYIECGIFDFNKDELPDWWEGEGFNPSTKEQSDILFQKMKEAGYVWDIDKKELRKEEIK